MSTTRRDFLRTAGAGAAGLALAGGRGGAQAGQRPNLVFIFSDDHSLATIGPYRTWLQDFLRQHDLTPNLDRLAREGGVFENSYCGNSLCGPSRATVLTGKHSHVNGFIDNRSRFDGSQWTVAKELQAAGYQTMVCGKWHLVSDPTGFDRWEILPGQGNYYNPDFIAPQGNLRRGGYVTDLIADRCLAWLKERDASKPFFLMCHHKAPHRNWMPPERYVKLLADVTIPEPANLFDDYEGRATPARRQEMEIARHMNLPSDLKVTPPLGSPEGANLKGEFGRMTPAQKTAWDAAYVPRNEAFRAARLEGRELTRWKYQAYMKDYLRCIKAVDDNVGKLLDGLRELGLDRNTVVIYCSDQGFYMGEHGWFDKRWMYEESLAMPFIIRWPGQVAPGTRFAPMIQNIDYAPTFLEMAGRPAPADVQGRSFAPILRGQTPADWRRSIYYHYYEFPAEHQVARQCGVRTAQHKLIHYYQTDEWELFDLAKDPREMRSVYADPAYATVVAGLKRELERLRTDYKCPPHDQEPRMGGRRG